VETTIPDPKGRLLVRARVKGDIERVFPKARVKETPNRDYRFRSLIPRKIIASVMAEEVMNIDYCNFKSSVREGDRHDAYLRCWSAMNALQRSRLFPSPSAGAEFLPWDEWDEGSFMRR
jgi:hypothetical protein